ncbi:MAG TPA: TonB-dependent receptor plug domain-containing protein, partial [Azospirillaceae bacterium]|nr:TonB-dependent receptor plug domain-containing protein [Azospirillaceae bacterium]
MRTTASWRSLLKGTAALALVLPGMAAGTAQAQDQQLEEIVITGSRIRSANLVSTSPVTVIGSEEVKLQGTTRVEDLVNNLPQAFADQGGAVSNGASGTATVNLRNLGPTRTLVLVDGRRLPAGTPTSGTAANVAPDLNQIPAALIERVEVVTGGASAVYGSDAVAGVVNFIMQDDFEGVRVDAQYSFYQHENDNKVADIVRARGFDLPDKNVTDGFTKDVTAVLGVNSENGKGNLTLYAGYREIDALTQAERDFSACATGSDATGLTCSGSGTTSPARIQAVTPDGNLGTNYTLDPGTGNTFRPYVGARDAFNFAPYNYYQRPDKRYTMGAMGHYEINEAVDVYAQLMFHDDRTIAQIAPSGLFYGNFYQVPCSNPLLSADQVQKLCTDLGYGLDDTATVLIGKRNVEGGGRQDDRQHTSYRMVGGFRGDLGGGWNYDVYGSRGEVVFAETYLNDFSVARGQRALNVVRDPATGQAVCASVLDGTDPNCVPYNIFSANGVTPAALAYLQTPGFQRGHTRQYIASGSLSGDLGQYGVQSPVATSGVGIALGAEYRKEALLLRTDNAFTTGDLAGQGGPTIGIEGSFNVKELFGELRVPLVEGQPF